MRELSVIFRAQLSRLLVVSPVVLLECNRVDDILAHTSHFLPPSLPSFLPPFPRHGRDEGRDPRPGVYQDHVRRARGTHGRRAVRIDPGKCVYTCVCLYACVCVCALPSVPPSFSPCFWFVKMYDELVALMGAEQSELIQVSALPPSLPLSCPKKNVVIYSIHSPISPSLPPSLPPSGHQAPHRHPPSRSARRG